MEDKPEHFQEVEPAWTHHCFAGNPESCQCYHQQPLKNEEEGSTKGKGNFSGINFFTCYTVGARNRTRKPNDIQKLNILEWFGFRTTI